MHIITLHSFHKNTFLLMWLHNSKRVEAAIMVQVVLWDTLSAIILNLSILLTVSHSLWIHV